MEKVHELTRKRKKAHTPLQDLKRQGDSVFLTSSFCFSNRLIVNGIFSINQVKEEQNHDQTYL